MDRAAVGFATKPSLDQTKSRNLHHLEASFSRFRDCSGHEATTTVVASSNTHEAKAAIRCLLLRSSLQVLSIQSTDPVDLLFLFLFSSYVLLLYFSESLVVVIQLQLEGV